MMLYTKEAQLALHASLFLALEEEGSCRTGHEIASALGVPAPYLSKILNSLRRAGLLRAVHGPGGGVLLARSAREIHLWDVLSAIEPVGEFERCYLSLDRCSGSDPCPLHELWAPIRARILEMLQTQSLFELATEAMGRGALRLERRRSNRSRLPPPVAGGKP